MSAQYAPQVGDRVDVTITGARVTSEDTYAIWVHDDQGRGLELPRHFYGMTVMPGNPEQWPPRPGDVWIDGDGDKWFAVDDSESGAPIRLVCARYSASLAAVDVMGHPWSPPLRLVYRDGWTPGEPATAVQPAATEDQKPEPAAAVATEEPRTELVRDLRAMAQYIEDTPQLKVGRSYTASAHWAAAGSGDDAAGAAAVRAVAEVLGVEVETRVASSGNRHWSASREFSSRREAQIRVSYVADGPANELVGGGEPS